MFTAFSSLSLNVAIWLCSSWSRLVCIWILRLMILSINNKFIVNLLSWRYIYCILLLIMMRRLYFMRSSLISILSLRKFCAKIFFILLLSLIELHFHVLLKCTNRFVAFMVLIGCNRNLIRLLYNSMSLLILLNTIFLRIASLVTSQIYLFKFIINFIVFNDFSNHFSDIFLVS